MHQYTGTNHSDILVGDPTDAGVYTGFGINIDIVTGGQNDDVFNVSVDQGRDRFDGGGGVDLLDYSTADRGLQIDLDAGHVTATYQMFVPVVLPPSLGGGIMYTVQPRDFIVADIKNFENVTGSDFGDTITGTSGANTLDGGRGDDHLSAGAGANIVNGGDDDDTITLFLEGTGHSADLDTIDGGNGNDTLDFSAASPDAFGISVALQISGAAVVSSIHVDGAFTHFAQEATVTGIENVTGTDQADVIQGDGDANILIGNDGADVMSGGNGIDYLDGGAGNDSFLSLSDRVTDEIHGGDGIDTVSYTHGSGVVLGADDPDHAVIVSLADNGDAGTAFMFFTGSSGQPVSVLEDRLYDVENITGSDQSDTLTGNSAANVLMGGFGQDHLDGGGNADVLNGGAGHDVLTGGTGADTFQFSDRDTGVNADTVTDFKSGVDHLDFSGFYSQAFQFHNFHSNNLPPPTFIGDHAFSGQGNEVRIFVDHGNTMVQLQLPSEENGLGNTTHFTPDVEVNLGQHAAHFSDLLF